MLETNLPTVIAPSNRPRARPEGDIEGLIFTLELLCDFLDSLQKKGRSQSTIQTYRGRLYQLYEWLPEGKEICRGTLEEWKMSLLADRYSSGTVNLCMSAANSFLEACGRRELQIVTLLKQGDDTQPELTRNEYLRLLSTARALGKEREYLMVKIFAATGISVRDLSQLTVEAAEAGEVKLPASILHIPECLREELLDYAKREGIASGPVFVTKTRVPYSRTAVTALIQRLCHDARVPEERANPRCLRKLYQTTQAGIQANIALLVEQSHDRLLEAEQLDIGWKQGEVRSGGAVFPDQRPVRLLRRAGSRGKANML